MKDIKLLIDSYIKHIRSDFQIDKIDNNIYEVITPFLDRRNDMISIYIELNKDNIRISDDGYTLNDLSMSGIDITSKRRDSEIKSILLGHGVSIQDGAISVITDQKSFPKKQHGIIQSILSINDLYLTSRTNVLSLFTEEISNFFDDNDIMYVANTNIEGSTGFSHKFDFVMPKQVTRNKKESLVKAINNPKKTNIEATIFAFEDTIGRSDDNYVLLNDYENTIGDDIHKALSAYNITPLLWSKKEEIKNRFMIA